MSWGVIFLASAAVVLSTSTEAQININEALGIDVAGSVRDAQHQQKMKELKEREPAKGQKVKCEYEIKGATGRE